MLKQRVITALILAPLAIWGIFALESTMFSIVMGLIILIGMWEWGRLVNSSSIVIQGTFTAIGIAIMLALHFYGSIEIYHYLLYLAMAWWVLGLIMVLSYPKSGRIIESSQIVRAIVGLVVLVPAWISMVMLHQKFGPFYLLILMFLVWGADSGAYFAGRQWGKTKLAPNVSPKKTWEGVIGGMVMAIAAVYLMSLFVQLQHKTMLFLIISFFTIAISVLGDLVESMFKRSTGIKDSGGILPGHGGILDRIDSLTAAGPFFMFALVM